MTKTELKKARELHEIVGKRLQNAELLLSAGLLRLSMLDAEISKLCIERAELSLSRLDADGLPAIEMQRRMAAARIEELKRRRHEAEAECERLRGDTRELLQRKIAIDAAIDDLVREQQQRRRRNA